MKKTITISYDLWEDIKIALGEAASALDDAGSVVDPGDDEERAYEREVSFLKEVGDRIMLEEKAEVSK
jgi:hypothetical protein